VQLLQVQDPAYGVDLRDKAFEPPEGSIVRLIRAAASELIIEDHQAVRRPCGKRFHGRMPGARSAMQEQQGDATPAHTAIPDLVAIHADGPFLHVHSVPLPRGRAALAVAVVAVCVCLCVRALHGQCGSVGIHHEAQSPHAPSAAAYPAPRAHVHTTLRRPSP
jgi:hypothetical protein